MWYDMLVARWALMLSGPAAAGHLMLPSHAPHIQHQALGPSLSHDVTQWTALGPLGESRIEDYAVDVSSQINYESICATAILSSSDVEPEIAAALSCSGARAPGFSMD